MDSSPRLTLRQAFAQPAALVMFFFGFASGLPFLLVGSTLSTWLKDNAVSLEQIGLVSLVGLTYSFKFLWSPAVDSLRLPLLSRLGQRRSWLLLAQAVLAAALLWMAWITPAGSFARFVVAAALVAFAGATQDVVIDAYRIEIAPLETQGALAATATLGYRIALLVSGALALLLADHIAWSLVYSAMACAVLLVMLATLAAREPETLTLRSSSWRAVLRDGVIGPFRDFFQRYNGWLGVMLLLFMGLFKIPDQMIGVMAFPFYLDSGFSKTDIAAVSKLYGVWVGIGGAFIGGAVVAVLGVQRSLLLAMLLGAVSNLLYIFLAISPGNVAVFTAVITGENLSGGFLGTVAVAWLSSLVSREYTATQYALFSSLVALPGKLVGGFSGFLVGSFGYKGFFIFSTLSILPALVLFFWLMKNIRDKSCGHDGSSNAR
ncbi:MAG TPA: MFS transporter [Pseudomonadales bacterium]|jgi:PAT family beta-lactamase induction signal transducer AmpG|nr:MFS transporter [Pseudomonadales bacterium]